MPALPREPSGRQKGGGRLSGRFGPARGSLVAVTAVVVSLVLGVVAYAGVVTGDVSEPRSQARPGIRPVDRTRISGHVVGLYPGGVRSLRVRIQNTGRRPLTVRSIRAIVRNPSASCSAANVEVRPFHGHLRLPPRGQRRVRLRIAMRPDAANACQRATFPLTYRASVVPAAR
jgi:hypothetical protein